MKGSEQNMNGSEKQDGPLKEEQLDASRVGEAPPPWKRQKLFLTVNDRPKEKSLLNGGYLG